MQNVEVALQLLLPILKDESVYDFSESFRNKKITVSKLLQLNQQQKLFLTQKLSAKETAGILQKIQQLQHDKKHVQKQYGEFHQPKTFPIRITKTNMKKQKPIRKNRKQITMKTKNMKKKTITKHVKTYKKISNRLNDKKNSMKANTKTKQTLIKKFNCKTKQWQMQHVIKS